MSGRYSAILNAENRQKYEAVTGAVTELYAQPDCGISFVSATAQPVELACFRTAGPVRVPYLGEIIRLHEVGVRVVDIATEYDRTSDGRPLITTTVVVGPPVDIESDDTSG